MITFSKEKTEKTFRDDGGLLYVRYIYHIEKDSVPIAKFYHGENNSFFRIGERQYDIVRINKWYQSTCYHIIHEQKILGEFKYLSNSWVWQSKFRLTWDEIQYEVLFKGNGEQMILKSRDEQIVFHLRMLRGGHYEADGFVEEKDNEEMIIAALFFLRELDYGLTISDSI